MASKRKRPKKAKKPAPKPESLAAPKTLLEIHEQMKKGPLKGWIHTSLPGEPDRPIYVSDILMAEVPKIRFLVAQDARQTTWNIVTVAFDPFQPLNQVGSGYPSAESAVQSLEEGMRKLATEEGAVESIIVPMTPAGAQELWSYMPKPYELAANPSVAPLKRALLAP